MPAWARADLYDWDTATVNARTDQDVGFYRAVVDRVPPGPVLELAAGTGRVAVPLARLTGRVVVASDIDEAMLAGLRGRAGLPASTGPGASRGPAASRGAVASVVADMRALPVRAGRLAAVIIPYNSLQLLPTDEDRHRCLAGGARLLLPGGRLALEVSDFQGGGAAPLPPTTVWEATVELGGRLCELALVAAVDHDASAGVTRYRRRWRVRPRPAPEWEQGEQWEEWADDLTLRSLDAEEATRLLGRVGLVAESVEADSYRFRIVARPAGAG